MDTVDIVDPRRINVKTEPILKTFDVILITLKGMSESLERFSVKG